MARRLVWFNMKIAPPLEVGHGAANSAQTCASVPSRRGPFERPGEASWAAAQKGASPGSFRPQTPGKRGPGGGVGWAMLRAAPPVFLPTSELPWPRRLGVALGAGTLVALWGREALDHPNDAVASLLLVVPLAASLLLANLNHVGAQIVARGLWWAQLVFGVAVSVLIEPPSKATLGFSLGAGGALLAAGTAGLRADSAARGAFRPTAFRWPLVASIALSVAEVQTLGVASWGLLRARDTLGLELGACALLLACALVGLYRLRFWGVLLHLLTTLLLGGLALRALLSAETGPVSFWGAGIVAQLLLPLPMLWAIARRAPVALPSSSPAPRLGFALVSALMAVSTFATFRAF